MLGRTTYLIKGNLKWCDHLIANVEHEESESLLETCTRVNSKWIGIPRATASSDAMRQDSERIPVNSRSIPPSPVSRVDGIFSNSLRRQPRAMIIAYIVFGIPWTTLTKN